MQTITFRKHFISNGTHKARVSYSAFKMASTGEDCVTLYAKGFDEPLFEIFADQYVNDSELGADYFDKGKVRILSTNPLYPAALAMCKHN